MTTSFGTSPVAGVDLDSKSSTAAFPVGTTVFANDGFHWTYVVAMTALGSTGNIIVADGSASAAASALLANFVCNTSGGVVAGQHFWARAKLLAALT